MIVEKKSRLLFLGIFPKCPFYTSVLQLVLTLALIALGTVGIYFLNLWVAGLYLIYAILFYFLAMPLWHCQYCYFKVKETAIDKKTGKTIEKLLTKDKWKESYLKKHVDNGKKWVINFMIIWFLPVVLIVITFLFSFSIYALISLIGFIVVLATMVIHMRRKVCSTCSVKDECFSAF